MDVPVWQALIDHEYVHHVDLGVVKGLQMTVKGMTSLTTSMVSDVPRQVFAVREHLVFQKMTGL